MARIHVIGSQRVNKHYWDFRSDWKRCFLTQLVFCLWEIMVKVLPCRSEQCLGHVNKLTLEGCSKTGAFGQSINHISWTQGPQKYLRYEADSFISKCAKFGQDRKNATQILENLYAFEDNGVWTSWGKFSQLSREYMWAAVNLLPNRPGIWDLSDRDAFLLNFSLVLGIQLTTFLGINTLPYI